MTELAQAARLFSERLAQEAVSLLQEGMAQHLTRHSKGPGDWSTELDLRIEQHLRSRIAAQFPSHAVLGEEEGLHGPSGHPNNKSQHLDDAPLLWVIDPIDGSVNFSRGYPQYSVSIALLQQGEPIACCIADPCRSECFSAARGQGAALNQRPIKVSSTDQLSEALGATVFPKPNAQFMDSYLKRLGVVTRRLAGLRRAGSMALELAYLAAGRLDCFWQRGMGPWDAAAGVLLIREAGGCIFTLDGLPWLHSNEVCAATPALAADWQALLQSC